MTEAQRIPPLDLRAWMINGPCSLWCQREPSGITHYIGCPNVNESTGCVVIIGL